MNKICVKPVMKSVVFKGEQGLNGIYCERDLKCNQLIP